MKTIAFCGLIAVALLALPAAAFSQTSNFAAGSTFTASQQAQITAAQQQALAAVENALAYLRAVGLSVVSGTNAPYNSNLGQFFDQSSANPLLGQYNAQLNTTYGSADLTAMGRGVSTTGSFIYTPSVLQGKFPMTSTGALANPGATFVYVRGQGSLYSQAAKVMDLSSIATTQVPTKVPTTTSGSSTSGTSTSGTTQQINFLLKDPPLGGVISQGGSSSGSSTSGSTGNQQLPVFKITSATYLLATGQTGPNIPLAAIHKVDAFGQAVDTTRYTQMVNLLTSLRNSLAGTITYSNALEANRLAIFNALNTTVGSNTRGFEQYGFSTSDSTLKQAADLARLVNPSLNPLAWYQDFGARTGGTIAGNLLPGQRNNFFEDKFTVLSTGGTVYVGQSALNGSQALNNGLFDSTSRPGQTQSTGPLFQQIIEAFTAGLTGGGGLGGRTAQFGLNEINAANGNVNIQTTGFSSTFFPQDRDVGSILNFITNSTVQRQGNDPTAVPAGKIGIAAGAVNPAFTNGGLIVPLN